jgi:hypothetical protein
MEISLRKFYDFGMACQTEFILLGARIMHLSSMSITSIFLPILLKEIPAPSPSIN